MSQSAFFWPGNSFMTTLMPAAWARSEDRLERLAVIRNDADHVDLLGDQILDRAHLLRGVVGRRVHDGRIDAQILPAFSTPFATLSNHGIFTLPTTPICGGLLAANALTEASVVAAPKAAAPFISVRRVILRMPSSLRVIFIVRSILAILEVDRPLSDGSAFGVKQTAVGLVVRQLFAKMTPFMANNFHFQSLCGAP